MPTLVSADSLARQGGVKLLAYGPPGTGKTPICGTAPRPVLLSVENGTRSLAGLKFACERTREPKKILDFFKWYAQSKEARQFDTLCIDSISEVADIVLNDLLSKKKDPRQAYGELDDTLSPILKYLCAMPEGHLYMIAQLDAKVFGDNARRWPYMPGKVMSRTLPHETDEVYYIDRVLFPGLTAAALCFQTFSDPITEARSRAVNAVTKELIVSPYEEPHLGKLFEKITGRKQQK